MWELGRKATLVGLSAAAVTFSGCVTFDSGTYNNRKRAAEFASQAAPVTQAPVDAGNMADAKAALDAAAADVASARKLSPKWGGAADVMAMAQSKFEKGHYEAAEDLAKHVSAQSAGVENAYFVRQARKSFDMAAQFSRMTEDQYQRLRLSELAILRSEGRRSATMLKGLLAEMRAAKMMYTVVSGDTLWRISGKAEVYGNPLLWPLIYKANRQVLATPESLEIGQQLTVRKNPLLQEIRGAVDFARERARRKPSQHRQLDEEFFGPAAAAKPPTAK